MYVSWSMTALDQAPPVLPVDITGIIAVIGAFSVVLIPIIGMTARFALKPIAEAVAKMRESQTNNREIQVMEQRIALMEQQLSNLETDVREIEDKSNFDRQLAAPNE